MNLSKMDESRLEAKLASFDESTHDLIKELLWEYFTAGDEEVATAAMAVRRRRLERERDALEERRSKISESIKEAEEELKILEGVADDINDRLFDHALEKVKHLPPEERDPSNAAIETQAQKVGLAPHQFIDLLNERYPVDQFGNLIEE